MVLSNCRRWQMPSRPIWAKRALRVRFWTSTAIKHYAKGLNDRSISAYVNVLVTLAPTNYPLGHKDILTGGDIPVVWTNTRFPMLYINMGHGDASLASDTQNMLLEDALLWLGRKGRP